MLDIDPKYIYQWQKAARRPVAAVLGADPATVAELHQLRAATRLQVRELEILKKAIAIFHSLGPMSRDRLIAAECAYYMVRIC